MKLEVGTVYDQDNAYRALVSFNRRMTDKEHKDFVDYVKKFPLGTELKTNSPRGNCTAVLYPVIGPRKYLGHDGGSMGTGAAYWADSFNPNVLVSREYADKILRNPSVGYEKVDDYDRVEIYEARYVLVGSMTQQEVIDEENRKTNLRTNALAKLTEEEKKELGLA